MAIFCRKILTLSFFQLQIPKISF